MKNLIPSFTLARRIVLATLLLAVAVAAHEAKLTSTADQPFLKR